jgi:hypothetical protein
MMIAYNGCYGVANFIDVTLIKTIS